jgi:chemotaxis protein MotB
MKTIYKILFFSVCISFFNTSCVSKKKFEELEAEKNALAMSMEEMRTDLEGQISSLREDNEGLSSTNSTMKGELGSLKNDLSNATSKMSEMEGTMKENQASLDMMRGELGAAFGDVEAAVASSNQRIKDLENFLYLDLEDPVDFGTASSTVKRSDKESLMSIAEMLKGNPNLTLMVEGNADKRSISNDKHSDNWDLSVSRSANVVRELIKMGVNPEQLIASGRAEFNPSVTDDPNSKETLQANRRTEFIVVPNVGRIYKVYKDGKSKS